MEKETFGKRDGYDTAQNIQRQYLSKHNSVSESSVFSQNIDTQSSLSRSEDAKLRREQLIEDFIGSYYIDSGTVIKRGELYAHQLLYNFNSWKKASQRAYERIPNKKAEKYSNSLSSLEVNDIAHYCRDKIYLIEEELRLNVRLTNDSRRRLRSDRKFFLLIRDNAIEADGILRAKSEEIK